MDWLGKLIVAVVKGAIASFLARLHRDKELKQEGREEVIENAHREADDRKDAADQLEKDFAALTPDERERLRLERDIYRD